MLPGSDWNLVDKVLMYGAETTAVLIVKTIGCCCWSLVNDRCNASESLHRLLNLTEEST